MSNIINLTPHAIVVKSREYHCSNCGAVCATSSSCTNCGSPEVGEGFTGTRYEPSGSIVRLEFKSKIVDSIDGVVVSRQILVGHNLPEPEEGTFLLVSAMVLTQAKLMGRTDCIAPDTNNATRNDLGHITSVPGFVV